MTDYKPGTVAMITWEGEHMRAFYDEEGDWTMQDGGVCDADEEPRPTDVAPLVCMELTTDDAELLERLSQYVIAGHPARPRQLLERITKAIREQTATPEPLKRWTATSVWLRRDGECAALFDEAEQAQRAADALNAAETTS